MIVWIMGLWVFNLAAAMFLVGWLAASMALSYKVEVWRDRCEELELELAKEERES